MTFQVTMLKPLGLHTAFEELTIIQYLPTLKRQKYDAIFTLILSASSVGPSGKCL